MTRSRIFPPRGVLLIILGVLSGIECGCVSSQLRNVWMDRSLKDLPLTNILVIAAKKNAVSRRIWEDGFVAELSAHQVACTPSYRLFPKAVPDTQEVVAAVGEKKFDGVLVVRRLATDIATYDKPAYNTIYREVTESVSSDTLKIMRHEITLWSTKENGQLMWAGTGETLDPTSREEVRGEITGLIIPELARQGLIPTK